jgi:hypothetical protein
MYRLPWGKNPASQGRYKLDWFVINHSALDVVESVDASVRSHGDLTFVDFFAVDTIWQGHSGSLLSDKV